MSEHTVLKMTDMNYGPDRPTAANPVKVMDLTLRDGHQSLFATRGRTEDMIPVAEAMDDVGFWAVETWGGATFDTWWATATMPTMWPTPSWTAPAKTAWTSSGPSTP